jgi:hypothetical protein
MTTPTPEEIFAAVKEGDTEKVEKWSAEGVDFNIQELDGSWPIHAAVLNGHLALVKLFVEKYGMKCANDNDSRRPLHLALREGHVKIVKFLIASGATLAAKPISGEYVLHKAAVSGKVQLVEMILEKGVELDDADRYGATPLAAAALQGHTEVVELLLKKGAAVEGKDPTTTPLIMAARNGFKEVAESLINHGAKVMATGFDKNTPLHEAAHRNHLGLVKLLLAHGADPNSKNEHGQTPFDLATTPLIKNNLHPTSAPTGTEL